MKRVLILVLSTDKPPYDALYRASRETWDSQEVEGVETVFYFAQSCSLCPQPHNPKILRTDSDDDFFSMGRKTLAAFEWALANRQFDYIFRANASLYLDKPGLLQYAQRQPETGLALGVVADCGNFEGTRFSFLWGPGYLLSRDVVETLVKFKDIWNHRMMDDNAISVALQALGIPLDNRGSLASVAMNKGWYEFVYYENGVSGGATMFSLNEIPNLLPGQFAFRVKDDANRENDVKLMKELQEVFKI